MISGEHGIGITKLEFLSDEEIGPFRAYKQKVDPEGRFNKGKLMPGGDMGNAYTPSFSLLGTESLIMEQSEIGKISEMIKNCLRCGKCKPVCSTHVPRANLLYSPRNKILGTSLLVEAFLYEEQTRRGISLKHFDEFNDVADHCTVCHRCVKPCPVDIDFGDVSVAMRNFLRKQDKKRFSPGTTAAMTYLNLKDPATIKLMRGVMMDFGFKAQRLAHKAAKAIGLIQDTRRIRGHGRCANGQDAGHPLPQPADAGQFAEADFARLARYRGRQGHSGHPQSQGGERRFGSCLLLPRLRLGASVLAGRSGHAGDALRNGRHDGAAAGLPVLRLPAERSGDADKGQKITTDNRVLFHRVANTLNYLDIKTVIVSCGTCMDQLQKYQFEKIFPGCRLLDIHEYLMEKGVKLEGVNGTRYMYHDPCHTPMKAYNPLAVTKSLMGQEVPLTDRCCGDSGSFAYSRPDIATQVKFRKQQEIESGAEKLRADGFTGEVKILTSCPACLQGLSRYDDDAGTKADYIVVEMAKHLLGENWAAQYVDRANNGGIERVLL